MVRLLVVDDSDVDRKMAGACAREHGFQPVYARNGEEALEKIATEQPEIVLSDLLMPEMDGLKLVKTIRKKHPGIPVVLMTAYGSEETAVTALQSGAAHYVPKRNLKTGLKHALRIVNDAMEAAHRRERIRGYLQQSHASFCLDFDPTASRVLVSYVQDILARMNWCDETGLIRAGTLLTEAIQNALDHGNLGLDSKMREKDYQEYAQLRRERLQQPPYCDRRVHITIEITAQKVMFAIRDEGDGFDVSTLPDPRDPANLIRPCGRGILLIRTFSNDVRFNEQGNEITITMCRRDDENAA